MGDLNSPKFHSEINCPLFMKTSNTTGLHRLKNRYNMLLASAKFVRFDKLNVVRPFCQSLIFLILDHFDNLPASVLLIGPLVSTTYLGTFRLV